MTDRKTPPGGSRPPSDGSKPAPEQKPEPSKPAPRKPSSGTLDLRNESALEFRRKQAIKLIEQDRWLQADVAKALGVTPGAVSQWWKAYQQQGQSGLDARTSTGRPGNLTAEQFAQLRAMVATKPLSAKQLVELVKILFGVEYSLAHASRLMRSLRGRGAA